MEWKVEEKSRANPFNDGIAIFLAREVVKQSATTFLTPTGVKSGDERKRKLGVDSLPLHQSR
jgi:hypothetical protein